MQSTQCTLVPNYTLEETREANHSCSLLFSACSCSLILFSPAGSQPVPLPHSRSGRCCWAGPPRAQPGSLWSRRRAPFAEEEASGRDAWRGHKTGQSRRLGH